MWLMLEKVKHKLLNNIFSSWRLFSVIYFYVSKKGIPRLSFSIGEVHPIYTTFLYNYAPLH